MRARLVDDIEKSDATLILPDQWPVVEGHIVWVDQVWINYISNGLKYGGSPPRLEVGFSYEKPTWLQFAVQTSMPHLRTQRI